MRQQLKNKNIHTKYAPKNHNKNAKAKVRTKNRTKNATKQHEILGSLLIITCSLLMIQY